MLDRLLSGRLASTCSPIRRSWERPHSLVPFWYLLKGFYWEQEKEDAGVFEDLIRVSVGIEDIEDLKADFAQAIEKIGQL